MTVQSAYRGEILRGLASPVFLNSQANLTAGQWSQYFNLIPPSGEAKNVGAALLEFTNVVTGSGTASAVQTSVPGTNPAVAADLMTLMVDQLQVAPAQGAASRLYSQTPRFLEMVEEISFDMNFGYPRASPTTFTATTAAQTYSTQLLVPIGGPAATLRFHVPALGQTFTAASGMSQTLSVNVSYIPVDSDMVFAAWETNTPSVSGNYDVSALIGQGGSGAGQIQPDYVIFPGATTTNILAMQADSQAGTRLLNLASTQAINFVQPGLYPTIASASSYSVTTTSSVNYVPITNYQLGLGFALRQRGVRNLIPQFSTGSSVYDIGWMQFGGSEVVANQQAPASLGSKAPAVKATGTPAANGGVIAKRP